jgi:hypothetical protein
MTSFQHTNVFLILVSPYSSIICYWFSWDLMPAYWKTIDAQVTSFQHNNECVFDSHVTSFQQTKVLLIVMWPHSSILMCYWFSLDLIPAYWCVTDSRVALFQHTEVLLILRWSHSSIIMCYWFSWYLMPAYWSIIDSQVT